jgi:hypothetical protein
MNLLEEIPCELLSILLEYVCVEDLINLYLTNPLYYERYITGKSLGLTGNSVIQIIKKLLTNDIRNTKHQHILDRLDNGDSLRFYEDKIIKGNNIIYDTVGLLIRPTYNSTFTIEKRIVYGGCVLIMETSKDRTVTSIRDNISEVIYYLIDENIELRWL